MLNKDIKVWGDDGFPGDRFFPKPTKGYYYHEFLMFSVGEMDYCADLIFDKGYAIIRIDEYEKSLRVCTLPVKRVEYNADTFSIAECEAYRLINKYYSKLEKANK